MARVGRPDCLVDLRLYKYGRPARAILGKQGGGKYSVFLVELRALALAVLAVQVPGVRLLVIFAFASSSSLRWLAVAQC